MGNQLTENMAYAARIIGYNKDQIKEAIKRVLSQPENSEVFAGKRTALIKINLLSRRPPERAVTTHPVFLRAVVETLREMGLDVLVADSPGGQYDARTLKGFYRVCGIEKAVSGTGAKLNFDTRYISVKGPCGKTFPVINPALECDVIVDVAKLKTHAYMLYTGTVKNMFGVIPGTHKAVYHAKMATAARFAGLLVDICETVKPHFCLIDGIVGMEGDGPSAGEPFEGNLFLAAKDPYVCDMAALYYLGIPVNRVLTAQISRKRGLCPQEIKIHRLFGAVDEEMKRKIKLPRSFRAETGEAKPFRMFASSPAPYPHVKKESCTGCGECAQSCPQKVIEIKNHKAVIHRRDCIKCYCCQELCPEQAIDLR